MHRRTLARSHSLTHARRHARTARVRVLTDAHTDSRKHAHTHTRTHPQKHAHSDSRSVVCVQCDLAPSIIFQEAEAAPPALAAHSRRASSLLGTRLGARRVIRCHASYARIFWICNYYVCIYHANVCVWVCLCGCVRACVRLCVPGCVVVRSLARRRPKRRVGACAARGRVPPAPPALSHGVR
jgi:hypothetical protein